MTRWLVVTGVACNICGCAQILGIEEKDATRTDASSIDSVADVFSDGRPDITDSSDVTDVADVMDIADSSDVPTEAGSCATCPADRFHGCITGNCIDFRAPYWIASAPPVLTEAGTNLLLDSTTTLTWRIARSAAALSMAEANTLCAEVDPKGAFRVPTRIETMSLLQFAPSSTTMDVRLATPSLGTSSTDPDGDSFYVDFDRRIVYAAPGDTFIRCVRGPTAARAQGRRSRKELDVDVVDDFGSGLTWVSREGRRASDDERDLGYALATPVCIAPYRLPTALELAGLLREDLTGPAVTAGSMLDATLFEVADKAHPKFWSSTLGEAGGHIGVAVFGAMESHPDAAGLRVRCVKATK